MLYVAVKDNGIGVSQARVKKLFRPFSKLPESDHLNQDGIGLGLHISKVISNVLGGQVGLFPNQRAGTTFWFSVEAANRTEIVPEDIDYILEQQTMQTENRFSAKNTILESVEEEQRQPAFESDHEEVKV